MQDVIRLLPDSLANQIAAGEVVQRPASVVKELIENSIDAGSQHIRLIVKDGGKTLIQVIDDGVGMSETDARMCFERHATSKISKTEDLFAIHTFGFRGEAMASIAAVAHVELKTRREHDEMGTSVRIEASKVVEQQTINCTKGTNIMVKNLFYNVPARRNFLKSNSVELRHIIEEFQRTALAYPEVAMSFYHNDIEVYNLKKSNLATRIISIFGKNYKEQLIACSEEVPSLTVKGYIGKPNSSKKTRGEQFFFANNRFIKHSYLHHAIMSAYEGLLIDDTFPFYVLFINIEPQRLDINVHPTKTEVKFDDERTVYAVINAAVKQALGKHHVTPSIDFDLDANYTLPGRMSLEAPEKPKKNAISNLKKQDYISPKKDWREWEKLFTQHIQQNIENVDESQTVSSSLALTLESAANKLDEYEQKENRKITFQIHNKYIISQLKSGMMMIDQQAAHEQVLYERYLKSLENRLGISQQLLFPKQITLSFADVILLTELESDMTAMGFIFESKDKNTIILKGVPADTLHYVEEKELLESIIEQFKQNRNELNVNRHENMATSIAKRTAIRNGTALTATEMNTLIDQLFACQSPHYSFEGKKIIVTLNLADLEKLFQS